MGRRPSGGRGGWRGRHLGCGGAKGKDKGKAAGKSEMPERGEWAAVDEVVSSLDVWEKKQNELFEDISVASFELTEALGARAINMLNEPVITGPDIRGKVRIRPVVAGKKREREQVQRYIVRERKRQEETDECITEVQNHIVEVLVNNESRKGLSRRDPSSSSRTCISVS